MFSIFSTKRDMAEMRIRHAQDIARSRQEEARRRELQNQLLQNQRSFQPTGRNSNLAPTSPVPSSSYQSQNTRAIRPGDVILSVNGTKIRGTNDLVNAVSQSGPVMNLVVRCSCCSPGTISNLSTRLDSTGHRFGVYSTDNPGGGARITSVMSNSAATRCVFNN